MASLKKAFTLIELLVVISIIALMMAILMPSLGKVRKMAKAVVCQSNARQIGQTMQMYANSNDGRIPPCRPGHPQTGPEHDLSDKYAIEWYYLLLQTAGVFESSDYDDFYEDQEKKFNSFMHCPVWNPSEQSEAWDWGYGMNVQLLSYDKRSIDQLDPTGTYNLPNGNFLRAPKIELIPRSSEMVYSADSPHYWYQAGNVSWITNKDEWLSALEDKDYPRPASCELSWSDIRNLYWTTSDPFRHDGYSSYVFLDGHSDKLKGDSKANYEMMKRRW